MLKLVLIVCLIANVAFAHLERPGQAIKHDRKVVNCAKFKREANQHSCVLTPLTMEGPFFLEDDSERSYVVDDQEGVPLKVVIKVNNAADCSPLSGLYVHIWSANATGDYSGFAHTVNDVGNHGNHGPQGFGSLDPMESLPGMGGMEGMGGMGGMSGMGGMDGEEHHGDMESNRKNPRNDDRYLRGYQITDDNGEVTFKTLIPGWYVPRCQHLHVEVYHDKQYENVTYVGQVFFPEDIIPELQQTYPYTLNENAITPHSEDELYTTRQGELITLTLNKVDDGYEAEIVLGVTPDLYINTDGIQVTNDLP